MKIKHCHYLIFSASSWAENATGMIWCALLSNLPRQHFRFKCNRSGLSNRGSRWSASSHMPEVAINYDFHPSRFLRRVLAIENGGISSPMINNLKQWLVSFRFIFHCNGRLSLPHALRNSAIFCPLHDDSLPSLWWNISLSTALHAFIMQACRHEIEVVSCFQLLSFWQAFIICEAMCHKMLNDIISGLLLIRAMKCLSAWGFDILALFGIIDFSLFRIMTFPDFKNFVFDFSDASLFRPCMVNIFFVKIILISI